MSEYDAEIEALRDGLAEALYAGGDEPEWLTTVDGSPNAAAYALADRVIAFGVALDALNDAMHEPCYEEIYSLDYFRRQQVDAYWITCTKVGPHAEHEDSNTGAHWGGGDLTEHADNDCAEGGAEAASATSASAKWVLDNQQPPSAPNLGPLSARDQLNLTLIAQQGRTLGEKPWKPLTGPPAGSDQ